MRKHKKIANYLCTTCSWPNPKRISPVHPAKTQTHKKQAHTSIDPTVFNALRGTAVADVSLCENLFVEKNFHFMLP